LLDLNLSFIVFFNFQSGYELFDQMQQKGEKYTLAFVADREQRRREVKMECIRETRRRSGRVAMLLHS
jgi:hypothetical protein